MESSIKMNIHSSNFPQKNPNPKHQQKSYLQQFSKYIKQKLGSEQRQEQTPSNRASMQLVTHLQRRKLVDNSPEQRFNRMMDQFKSLDTYIDVKGFIQDMNEMNGGRADEVQRVETEGAEVIREGIYETADGPYRGLLDKVNQYYSPRINRNILESTKQLDSLLKTMHGATRYSTRRLDQKNDTDLFEMNLYSKLFLEEPDGKDFESSKDFLQKSRVSLTKRLEDLYRPRIKRQEGAKGVNEKYYKEFKQKAQDIQAKLHHMLEAMHMQKWQDRRRNGSRGNQLQTESLQVPEIPKPILDSKFKAFAPKNVFRFRQDRRSKPSTRPCKLQLSSTLSPPPPPSHTSIPQQPHARPSHHPHNLTQFSPNKTLRQNCRVLRTAHSDLKRVKQNYSFKKPLIKETILRRIVDFIGVVENSQFNMRKENSDIMGEITKLEQNKQNDFDRFLDEKLMITVEEMKTLATRKGEGVI